jgi:hypothetical protein
MKRRQAFSVDASIFMVQSPEPFNASTLGKTDPFSLRINDPYGAQRAELDKRI